jgi:hypothetical protein
MRLKVALVPCEEVHPSPSLPPQEAGFLFFYIYGFGEANLDIL